MRGEGGEGSGITWERMRAGGGGGQGGENGGGGREENLKVRKKPWQSEVKRGG